MEDHEFFKKRFTKAKATRQLWNSTLEEAYDLFLPNRQTQRNQSPGEQRFTRLYNSTGVHSLQEFVNNLKQSLLPSYQQWAEVKPSGKIEAEVEMGQATQDDVDELARQMDIVIRVVFRYIWASNFDQSAHESLQDAAVSTGAMLLLDNDDKRDPLNFLPIPMSELIIEGNGKGGIGGVFREHAPKARDIKALFPKAKDDQEIEELALSNPDKEVAVIEGTLWNHESKVWDYEVYIELAGRKIFFTDIYKVSPWIIFRLGVAPGETMGRGPAINALPTMRVLNKLVSQLIYNNDMANSPPAMMDTNASLLDVSNVSLTPQSILPVQYSFDGQMSAFKYLETKANFNVGAGMKAEYQQEIRNMFSLPMLGAVTDPTKSATEMNIRNQQALSQQAAMFGRLQQEMVSAIIARAYYILASYDIVPKELEIGGEVANVKATSPLARVQDAADVEGTMRFIQTAMSFGESGMAMLATTINSDKLGPYLADKMGVPANLKLDDKERKDAKEQMTNAMAQQQQAMQQQQGGGNV